MGDDYLLTPYQLKVTNLIFNEHKYLLKKDSLQNIQISNYKSLVNNLDSTIIYKDLQIKNYTLVNKDLLNKNKKLTRLNYLFGGVGILAILIALIR